RGESDVGAFTCSCKRCNASGLGKAATIEAYMGKIGKGLKAERAGIDAVTKLTERLQRAGAVGRSKALIDAGYGDDARGGNVMPTIGNACPEGDIAPFRARIKTQMIAVGGSGRQPGAGLNAALTVTGQKTKTPVADEPIGAEQQAAR